MPDLAALRRELAALTAERNSVVGAAQATIAKANREYDRKAVPLAREIAKLEPSPSQEVEKPVTPKIRQRQTSKTEELLQAIDRFAKEGTG